MYATLVISILIIIYIKFRLIADSLLFYYHRPRTNRILAKVEFLTRKVQSNADNMVLLSMLGSIKAQYCDIHQIQHVTLLKKELRYTLSEPL